MKPARNSGRIPPEILPLLLKIVPDHAAAQAWLRLPRPQFGGKSALEQLHAGEIDDVKAFILGIGHGNFQ